MTPSIAANLAGWWTETSRALESPVMPMPATPMRPMTNATLKLFSDPPVKRFFKIYQAETLRTSVAPASQQPVSACVRRSTVDGLKTTS